MTKEEKQNTINNIISSMSGITGPKRDEIINKQLCHFFRASTELGIAVAEGLGVKIDEKMLQHV